MNQSGLSLEDSITLGRLGRYLKASEVLAKSPLSKQYCKEAAKCLDQVLKSGLKQAISGLESAVRDAEDYIKLTEAYLDSDIVKQYLVASEALIDSNEWEERNKLGLEYCLNYSEELLETHLYLHGTLKDDLGIDRMKQSIHEVKVFMDSEDMKTLKEFIDNQGTTQPELTRDEIIRWGERLYEWGVRIDEIWQQVSEFMELFSGLQ